MLPLESWRKIKVYEHMNSFNNLSFFKSNIKCKPIQVSLFNFEVFSSSHIRWETMHDVYLRAITLWGFLCSNKNFLGNRPRLFKLLFDYINLNIKFRSIELFYNSWEHTKYWRNIYLVNLGALPIDRHTN